MLIATIGIRLLPEEKELLAAIARRTDTTISQILRKMIRDYINSHGELAVEKENVYESI
jgi:predicted DNA-binding protein